MYNGTCSFKMDHKGFPLSTLALVKMMLWSAFYVRTERVLSVGRQVTWSRTAPLSLHVGIVGESGHRAPECPSDSLCSIWESGHNYEECPKAANAGETPVSVGGTWAKMAD
mgnify:CR=1 FL=1